jgi:uncharacterized protein YgbK (DUF1537 family)
MSGVLGSIADDFTGATDVAVAFRRGGLRTLLFFGVPTETVKLPPHDAVVVALKSRMLPTSEAVSTSLEALDWLRRNESQQIYVKYCSTFDSTPRGNIGPVLDALSQELSATSVVTTPSSPEHGRTQYQGYLFVGEALLAESHMRHHPVTPMTDSHLPRLLRAQTDETVALITHDTVRRGQAAVSAAIDSAKARYLLADAVSEEDLRVLGRAVANAPLVAGAAGLAGGLAAARKSSHPATNDRQVPSGPAAVLSGSCSTRTLEQIATMLRLGRPAHRLDPVTTPDPVALAADALAWYDSLPPGDGPLIYSSLNPADLKRTQDALGVERSAQILERATGLIATRLVERGVRRLIAAGGETSGAVVTALGISGGVIGAEAAPGVPWIHPVGDHPSLLLKSGNFGDPDLLATASAGVGS